MTNQEVSECEYEARQRGVTVTSVILERLNAMRQERNLRDVQRARFAEGDLTRAVDSVFGGDK